MIALVFATRRGHSRRTAEAKRRESGQDTAVREANQMLMAPILARFSRTSEKEECDRENRVYEQ